MRRAKVGRRAKRPVYFRVENLVRPATGEMVKALVCRSGVDRREMQSRKYRVGDEIRAELSKPRNIKFHGLAHALGQLAVDQIEGFSDLNAHDALKRLQRESGVQCESQDLDVPGFGKLTINVARSIAFDEMDEGEFSELYQGVLEHIKRTYWKTMSEDAIAAFSLMTERDS